MPFRRPQTARCVAPLLHVPVTRRFPPPWIVEEHNACFIVSDATGQALGYFYFEDEPGRRSAANLLTRDEARRDGGQFRQAGAAAVETVGPSWRARIRPCPSHRTMN